LATDEAYTAFAAMPHGSSASSSLMRSPTRTRRKRQLALAELDRARTEFFQNVTHELRAPLTMLLTHCRTSSLSPGVVLSGRNP
jgi:signal transduction histidine kinase